MPTASQKPKSYGIGVQHEGADLAAGSSEHDRFGLVGRGDEFRAVQQKRDLHRGMANPLVPVNKWMVLNQLKAKCGSLGHQPGVEVCTTKCLPGLSERRLQQTEVSQTSTPTALLDQAAMQVQHLGEGQPTHQARRR